MRKAPYPTSRPKRLDIEPTQPKGGYGQCTITPSKMQGEKNVSPRCCNTQSGKEEETKHERDRQNN